MNGLDFNCIYSHIASKESILLRKNEIMRYMGQKEYNDIQVSRYIDSLLPTVKEILNPKGVFVLKKIKSISDRIIEFDGIRIESENLAKNLSDCESVVMFALTVGSEVDRLITRKSHISPLDSLTVSAIATEAIESYADLWNNEIKERASESELYTRVRFSPGYGDFSIEFQKTLIAHLQATQRCGICLTDKMILTPSKTVTGIVGLSAKKVQCTPDKCSECLKKDCQYRADHSQDTDSTHK